MGAGDGCGWCRAVAGKCGGASAKVANVGVRRAAGAVGTRAPRARVDSAARRSPHTRRCNASARRNKRVVPPAALGHTHIVCIAIIVIIITIIIIIIISTRIVINSCRHSVAHAQVS